MVRYHPLLVCFCLISTSLGLGAAQSPARLLVHVGAVLDEGTFLGKMCRASIFVAVEDFYAVHGNYTTRLVIHVRDSGGDVAGAAWVAQDLLRDARVQAILGPQTSAQAELVADFGQKAEVPIISFSATSPSVTPAEKPYFIRAAFDDKAQVAAISSVLGHFRFREVVPICDGTSPGDSWVAHLVDALRGEGIRVPFQSSISPRHTDEQIAEELRRLIRERAHVFVVHLTALLGSRLFLQARDLGLMGEGHVWIVTDALANFLHLLDPPVVHAMRGVLGVRPSIPDVNELRNLTTRLELKLREENPEVELGSVNIFGLWAYDAAWALARAAEMAVSGEEISGNWSGAFRRKLARAISTDSFHGKSGEFRMSGRELRPSSFQVLNVVGEKPRVVGVWWPNSNRTSIYSPVAGEEEISWPGDSRSASRGWAMLAGGRKLRILVPDKVSFKGLLNVEYDPTGGSSPRISGFCIDVFNAVMRRVHYKVDYEYISSTTTGEFDAVVGDTTIMANRSDRVNFTLPYTETGIWMLVRTRPNESVNGWIFLDPLETDLWVGSLAFFFFTGFAVWAIEQRINSEFRGPPQQQFGTAVYFVFSTLVFSHRERLRSNLSRLVVMVWVFVVLIFVSTYTASLASMLTAQRLQPSTLEGLRINGEFVGYQTGSFVEGLFGQLNFDPSKLRAYGSPEEYEDALSKGSRNGGVSAIFDEMPYLRIFLGNRCSEYSVFGPVVNTKGFGFVFSKGSGLAADASRAILEATESGLMAQLEKKWFGDEISCRLKNSVAEFHRLSFKSFSGLFIVSGAVSAAAVFVFLGRYVCRNWDELRTLSSGRPFPKRVVAWARHYVRMEPTAVSGVDEPAVLGRSGAAVAPAEEAAYPAPAASATRVHPGASGSSTNGGCAVGREDIRSSSTDEPSSSATPARGPPSTELTLRNGRG
ncbi:unnamed protein product [Spirodela intermedia]|uniref:Glutamate receptor n=1 Tax=Spirodela intermedia TaxID=51605 RepID=A0A7I8KP09_SPIIN|nr:unnamed protein product [Spirodela intermedia]